MQPPKALIFDLGGVIVPFDFKLAYARLQPLCGYTAAEIPERIRSTGLVPRLETGEIEAEHFAEELLKAIGVQMSYREFCDALNCIFLPGPILPQSFFESLKQRYRLVLLSNTNIIHYEMLRDRYPLLDEFHEQVLSYQVGAVKPSPEIYREAVARAGCRPGECFFTDDVAAYVEAARAEGIDAVQFISREQLELELHHRGVEWGGL